MSGLLLLVPVAVLGVGAAVVGWGMRLGRAGMAKGIAEPALRTMPWFAGTVAGMWLAFYVLAHWDPAAGFSLGLLLERVVQLVLGFAVGAGLYLLLLGWDELADRLWPTFYACVRREVGAFFSTSIPYFVLVLFLLLSGFFFWGSLKGSQQVTLRYVFESLSFFGFFLFPLLTMGLFAKERSEGTIEVLMTAPVSDTSVVVSKFLGTMAFYLAMLLPTVYYYAVLLYIGAEIGKPDTGPVIAAYLGLLLTGCFFASLGLFTSTLTSSQILAALFSWVIIIFFLIAEGLSNVMGLGGTLTGDMLEFLDHRTHLDSFFKGVIEPKDVIYFLSFTVFFLFLSVRSIESRKWR